jgi:hypothetical protein
MKVYLQKYNGLTCEFLKYNLEEDRADLKSNLGNVSLTHGMSTDELIIKLRYAANLIAKHKGDVFVIQ